MIGKCFNILGLLFFSTLSTLIVSEDRIISFKRHRDGAFCSKNDDCKSNDCRGGRCGGRPIDFWCEGDDWCSTKNCYRHKCLPGDAYKANGDDCSKKRECVSNICNNNGKCVGRNNGAWCKRGDWCNSNYCNKSKCEDAPTTSAHKGYDMLPISIPLDRCFDVQWNPPGHPTLKTSRLIKPYKDDENRDGYYTFLVKDGNMSFVRKSQDGSIRVIYEQVDFNLIGENVLMFEGDKWYGTFIKGSGISSGPSAGDYATRMADSVLAKEWLLTNFFHVSKPDAGPKPSTKPSSKPSSKPSKQLSGRPSFKPRSPRQNM